MPTLAKRHRGFTLIELLVVVAIIGILATIALVSFRYSQLRTRDAERKSDLKQIASALELFYSDYKLYPSAQASGKIMACPYRPTAPATSSACDWGDDSSNLTDGKTVYFRKLPQDPSSGNYSYRVIKDGQAFQLYAHLENTEDKDCIGGSCSSPTLPDDNTPNCGGEGLVCNFAITSANVTALDNE
jgi:type II secretion system protein G